MGSDPEDKVKRSRRRQDTRRKNLRDNLPRLHKDTKQTNKKNRDYKYDEDENEDGDFSR